MTAIRAESFELTDKTGTVRAIIDLSNAESPTIRLFDDRGNVRLGLYVLPNGSGHIQLWDRTGQPSWHTPYATGQIASGKAAPRPKSRPKRAKK
jgi:hypothetical protein